MKVDIVPVSEEESESLGELERAGEGERGGTGGTGVTARLFELERAGISSSSRGGRLRLRRDTRIARVNGIYALFSWRMGAYWPVMTRRRWFG